MWLRSDEDEAIREVETSVMVYFLSYLIFIIHHSPESLRAERTS